MGGLFVHSAANNASQQAAALGLSVSTSVYGLTLPIIYGATRVPGNMIWYGAFTATPQYTQTSSGKGGGGNQATQTGYGYTASFMLGICEGPIGSIHAVWNNGVLDTTDTFSTFTGGAAQAAWGYLTTMDPIKALTYRNLAYIAAANYNLGSSPSLPQLTFEVYGQGYGTSVTGIPDVDPVFIITDILTNARYGAGFPAANMGTWTSYKAYCIANGLLFSPAYDTTQSAAKAITDLLALTNAEAYFSEGLLKITPYGDTAITANSYTYTPNITPIYELGDDAFLVSGTSDPVLIERGSQADAYNQIDVECLDRSNSYNKTSIRASDQVNVDVYGLRAMSNVTAHQICNTSIAQSAAQLILQRNLYIRNKYTFTLPIQYILLEPTDYVTLDDPALGLVATPVRILTIDESGDELLITAEDAPAGISSHAVYGTQTGGGGGVNNLVLPGSTAAPNIFVPPSVLTATGLEIWMGAYGAVPATWGGCEVWVSYDNVSYAYVGAIDSPARMGKLTATLASGSDPDTTNTLAVNVLSGQSLGSATVAEWNNYASLTLVDSEYVAYQTATLTASYNYLTGGTAIDSSTSSGWVKGTNTTRIGNTTDHTGGGNATVYSSTIPNNSYVAVLNGVSFISNTHYTITVWAKIISGTCPIGGDLIIAEDDTDGAAGTLERKTLPFSTSGLTSSWQQFSLSFNSVASVTGNIYFLADFSNGAQIAIGDAWLTTDSGYSYNLTTLHRGLYGSAIASHAAGANFVRVDQAMFKMPFTPDKIGQTIYVKLPAYNQFGSQLQQLSACTANTYTIAISQVPTLTGIVLTAVYGGFTIKYAVPTQSDFGGVNVYMSATSGFTPGSGNLVYSGPDSLITITTDAAGAALVGGTTYYVRIAGYTKTSKANMSYSSEYSIVPITASKSATASLYQWYAGTPGNPSGTSVFTWSTYASSSYTGGNGWQVSAPANPGTPGLQLWIASKAVSDNATATTTSVSWASGYTILVAGANGTAGAQTATPTVYQWAATIPSGPSGAATYTWSTGGFGSAPSGWALTPGTSPSSGYTLWDAKLTLIDATAATTTAFNWTSSTISAIGYAGGTGASSRIMYARITGNPTPTTGTVTTSGNSSFPTGTNWGLTTTWYATDPNPSSTDSLYQSDGIYSPSTGNTVWSTPYISALKVGSLSAITTNTGSLTISGTLTSNTAAISGTTMTGAGGVLYSSGQFAFGNATTNLSFNGSAMTLNGNIVDNSNLMTNAVHTGNLQDNAATLVQSVYTVGGVDMSISVNPTDVTVQTISVTTIGGQVTILTSMKMAPYTFVANSATFFIKRDGVSVYTRAMGTAFEAMIATPYVDSPPAGYHTYTIGFTMTTSQPSCGAYQRLMSIFEARK